jgi:Tol biopolymer transport system component
MKKLEEAAEQLFGEALDLPRAQREAFLERVCAGKPQLRRMVEELLDENDRLSGFLSEPVYGKAQATTAVAGPVLAAGTRLLDRYLIVSTLGSGGMGVVYRARDEKLEREVAIKMLQPGVLSGEESRGRFRREARALAKLNHAHIAAVHDVIEEQGADYIVMELVVGESLAARMKAGPLDVKEATAIALQVAEALEEAHEQGVIHRDLKPANVMITPKGQAKVLDFGLAKLTGPADATQTALDTSRTMGTPMYMSPEQAIGQKADERSDLWSLGVTYYESLTGTAPFRGGSSLAILRAITDEPVRPLREVKPKAPALADQIVARAMEKDPELRYQHARDFATDLRRVLRDLEPGRVTGSAAIIPTSGTKKFAGWKLTAMIAGAAVLVVATGMAYWMRPVIQPPRVLGMMPLTHDDTEKVTLNALIGERLMTDGTRVYYEVETGNRSTLKQVSTEGGEAEEVPIPLHDHNAVDLRNASELLTLGDPLNATNDAGGVWHMTIPGGAPRRIGNFKANDASWSPDGESIDWSSEGDVFTTRLDGSGTRKILTVPAKPGIRQLIGGIRISTDGKRMRFTVADMTSLASALWEATADGKNARPLFGEHNGMENQCCGMWTADGRYYIFQSDRGGDWNVWAMRERQHWWEKTDGKPVRMTVGATSCQLPLPSLDGKKILFVGTSHRGELVRYDVKKQGFTSILAGISADEAVYSRDRAWVAYVSVPDGSLWQSKADGGERHQLTFAPMETALPRWSPDGKRIAFMGRQPGEPWKIDVISVESDLPRVDPEALAVGADATWSPDGNSIAFNGILGTPGATPEPIRIMNLTTHQITTVPGSTGMLGARWSPDGKYLLAVASAAGNGPVMLYDFATGTWTPLAGRVQAAYPAWSNDGKCAYYYDSDLLAWHVCLADRKPQLVGKLEGAGKLYSGIFGDSFSVGPDDSLLVTRDIGTDQIYALDMDLP